MRLPGPGAKFTALIGIDSNDNTAGGRGSVDFSVKAGGVEKFRSGVMREGMPGKPLSVDLGGLSEFVLQMDDQNTVTVLGIVLARIYVLRNQLIHGGATWKSGVNRDQLRDCTNFMAKLVPLVIEIMMDHPKVEWGPACYPVVK